MGSRGNPQNPMYAASKHAIEGLAKSAALEAGRSNVRVNAVAPGPIDTGMLERIAGGAEKIAAVAAAIPAGRLGTPEEVADAIVFLASDRARYISGQILSPSMGARPPCRSRSRTWLEGPRLFRTAFFKNQRDCNERTLIALTVLAAGGASAQSSVTLFGVVDAPRSAAIRTRPRRRSASASRPACTGQNSSGYTGSRVGFRGTEDLGGGAAASF